MFFNANTKVPSYIPLPRFLLDSHLSLNAKLLYGLLLNRTQLSQLRGMTAEDGAVYVIYPIRQMAEDLGRSPRTINSALSELERAQLLQRVRQGVKAANRLFLQLPDDPAIFSGAADKDRPSAPADSQPPDAKKTAHHDAKKTAYHDAKKTAYHDAQNLRASKKDKELPDNSKERGSNTPRCYGLFQNVWLSDPELSQLRAMYPARTEEYIERLSAYMQSSGKSYASHYATLHRWMAEDQKKTEKVNYDDEYVYRKGEYL